MITKVALPLPLAQVAVLLYGFPPGVGATGTAALLNVPKSLEVRVGAGVGSGGARGPLDRYVPGVGKPKPATLVRGRWGPYWRHRARG